MNPKEELIVKAEKLYEDGKRLEKTFNEFLQDIIKRIEL